MRRRVVLKFGGADLSTGEKFRKAAEMVAGFRCKEIVVVVSAIGGTTDTLVSHLSEAGRIEDSNYAEVVSMGERTSARIFSSTLESLGVKSAYFDPQQDRWPIITDSNFKNAKPDVSETRIRVKKYLEPLLKTCIPVICGFLGKDKEGRVTLLGRGGSDITATLLGNCLEADEVILVKETDGVMSADPELIPTAKTLKRLAIEELFSLAHGGAKIVSPKALKYKLPTQRLRVISFSDRLQGYGTEITGVFKSNSAKIRIHDGLSSLTLVGDVNPKNLSKLFSALGESKMFGVSTGANSVTVFLKVEDPNCLAKKIHDLRCFKAVSSRNDVGLIELLNPDFIESPGWIAKISGFLAEKGINILEITTSKAVINVFVDENRLNEASTALDSL